MVTQEFGLEVGDLPADFAARPIAHIPSKAWSAVVCMLEPTQSAAANDPAILIADLTGGEV